jgi:hypothetical protein
VCVCVFISQYMHMCLSAGDSDLVEGGRRNKGREKLCME